MKNLISIFTVVVLVGIFTNSTAQNTNRYSGTVNYKGTDYYYETTCAGAKDFTTAKIETYGLTIFKIKKGNKKPFLTTHCTALEVRRNDSSIKEKFDRIKFTTLNQNGLAPEVKGTSKKVTLEFQFDNYNLIPQYNKEARMGCSGFDDAIKNVVLFILKELD